MPQIARAAPIALLALTLAVAGSAHAAIQFADVGKNLEYLQTNSTGSTTPFGNGGDNAFFFARVFYDSGNYDGGSVTFGGATTPFNGQTFDCCGDIGGAYQTGYLSKAAMDAQFPTNTTYALQVTDSTGTSPTTDINIVLPDDLYDSTQIPTFSAGSFDALNSLTIGQGLTIVTSTFAPDGRATAGQTFLTVFDLTSGGVVYSEFGANTRSSWDVGSGIFQAGHHYEAQLIFDNLVESSDGGVPTTARSDLRTDVLFDLPAQAAVPEPAAWALMLTGFGAIGATLRRRRPTAAAS